MMRSFNEFSLLILALVFFAPADALAASYKTCFLWEYQTTDSGGGEDYFNGGNNGGFAPAPGIHVEIYDWTNTPIQYEIADQDGCISWFAASSGAPFDLHAFTRMTDDNSNTVTIHDQGEGNYAPADIERYTILQYSPTNGGTDLFTVGDETKVATTAAMAIHTLESYNTGLQNMSINVGMVSNDCGANSAHFPNSNSAITSGVHRLTIGRCSDSNTNPAPGARRKFTIGHEMGHAMLALFYGRYAGAANGDEPHFEDQYGGFLYSTCGDGGQYGINSAEFSSVGYREGFAHFVSARVFNDKAADGTFTWFATPRSLEADPNVLADGGYVQDVCCAGCSSNPPSGVNTIGDWMRWLWDAHTNTWTCCQHNLTKREVYRLYAEARLEAEAGTYSRQTLFDALKNSMASTGANACLVVAGNGACGTAKVADAGGFNGLDF